MKFETAVAFIRELEELNGAGAEPGTVSITASYHLANEATEENGNRWSVTTVLYDCMGWEEPGQTSCPVLPPVKVIDAETVNQALDAWTGVLEGMGII